LKGRKRDNNTVIFVVEKFVSLPGIFTPKFRLRVTSRKPVNLETWRHY